MYLLVLVLCSVIFGGLFVYLAVRLLKKISWFLPWLRGTVGLICLLAAISIFIAAFDLSNYEELLRDRPIATVNFKKLNEQHYKVEISYYIDKPNSEFEIHGDQWQVDARIVRWSGPISALGAKPGFKLDRISGRYYSLEDERSKTRSVFSLSDKKSWFDAWTILDQYGSFVPGIDAEYGSAAFLPMADLASFELSLSHTGLVAKPFNEVAKNAVQAWR